MPYIGTSPSQGVRRVHTYTATANQTSFSGAGAEGATLSYKDSNFVDVYQNGVKLGDADYTATSGTAIVLGTGATVSDLVVIVAYDVFSAADTVSKADGGTFDGNVTMAGTITVTGNADLNGDLDVDGTTNLDAVDVDGAVNFAADVTFADGADIITASAGTSNFRAGVNAGNSIASGGNYNVAVGDEAGTALTTGDKNTAVGFEALKTEDAHGGHTAIGYQALKALDSGSDSFNTAVGAGAGAAMTTGGNNALVGGVAGETLDVGSSNVALGSISLRFDTKGSRAVAVGLGALMSQNFASATDNYNIGVGYAAGTAITTGIKNTIIGGLAGDVLTDADYNVAVGYGALSEDHKGNKSTAIGALALQHQEFANSTDSHNVAVGYNAGNDITTGTLNTFVGSSAGASNTTGYDNIVIGRNGGDGTGNAGGSAMVTGYRNILIGNEGSLSATDGVHQITLGSHIVGANSSFTFGNGGTDSRISVGATSITAPSDERYKEEITTSTAGLSFINDLRPVTFKWKKEKDIPTDHNAYVEGSDKRVMERGEKVNHGFIAQEVKTTIDNHSEIKDGFDMWQADPNDGRQRLAPSELIPMLVKAIQELSAKNDALEARIKTLEG